MPSIKETLEIGKGRIIQEGTKAAILNFGTRLEECKKASEKLIKKRHQHAQLLMQDLQNL